MQDLAIKENREIRGYSNMSTYGYFKHNEMSDYAIAHHGIKGQKWGIRRYQNADGSLTAEGMRRYGVYSQNKQIANKFDSMTSKMSKNKALLKDKAFMDEYKKAGSDWENELKKYKDKDYRKSIKTGKKMEKAGIKQPVNSTVNKNQQMVEYGNELLKTVDMIDQDGSIDKDPKRSRRAAMTGMKAYNKVFAGRSGILDLHSKGDIDWFLYEDQTPGMATVADLANQGYNKEQINALIEASYRNQDYDNRKSGMFGLSEGYYKLNDDYIDECIKNKHK